MGRAQMGGAQLSLYRKGRLNVLNVHSLGENRVLEKRFSASGASWSKQFHNTRLQYDQ
jgi:hypothetical protein